MAGSQLKVVFSSRCWEAEVVDIEIWMDSIMSSILYLASFISVFTDQKNHRITMIMIFLLMMLAFSA